MKSIYELYREVPAPFVPVHLADTAGGQPIELSFGDFYKHVHILGVSGKGKSRAIEYLLRQFLLNRIPFTLIDPHGSIYKPLVEWLAWQGQDFLSDRAIHLFNPSDPEFCPGYNPLKTREGENLADRVDWFIETMSQMLGGEDLELMQRYQLVFSAFVYAAAEKGLTVADIPLFLPRDETDLRAKLSQGLGNRTIATAWRVINGWTPREYGEFTGSFLNRMLRILRSPVTERILGQTKNCLDALQVMDEGQTLLCNLEPRRGFTDMSSQLLGRLIINELTQTALSHRVADKSRPHIMIIDECQLFLGEDIPRILDQTRKYGLHLVLSHQRIGQLRELSENICNGVMAGAQTKIIFGSDYQTGLDIANEIFGDLFDLQKVKERLKSPVVVGHELRLMRGGAQGQTVQEAYGAIAGEGEAYARGISEQELEGMIRSSAISASAGIGSGMSLGFDDPGIGMASSMDADRMNVTDNQFSQEGESKSEAHARTHSGPRLQRARSTQQLSRRERDARRKREHGRELAGGPGPDHQRDSADSLHARGAWPHGRGRGDDLGSPADRAQARQRGRRLWWHYAHLRPTRTR